MNAVRTSNLVSDMFASIQTICSAVFAVERAKPQPRPSTVPLEVRRQAIVPRSAPGPVLETMLKSWPMDRMVKEIVSLRDTREKASRDHDEVALEVCEHEFSKLAGLCEQHELKTPGYSKRMWEMVDELASKTNIEKVEPTVLDVIHGSNEPGTLGAELSDELRAALFRMTQPPVEAPQAEVVPTAPVEQESPEDVVQRAMQELANNQQSSI